MLDKDLGIYKNGKVQFKDDFATQSKGLQLNAQIGMNANPLAQIKEADNAFPNKLSMRSKVGLLIPQTKTDAVKNINKFAMQQAKGNPQTMAVSHDSMQKQLNHYNSIKRWFDSTYFEAVGDKLHDYMEDVNSPATTTDSQLEHLKELKAAVFDYLDHRVKENGELRSSSKGRTRIQYMQELLGTIMEQEYKLETAKWDGKTRKISDRQKNQIQQECDDITEKARLTGVAISRIKRRYGVTKSRRITYLLRKLEVYALEVKKLDHIIKNGKIDAYTLNTMEQEYYTGLSDRSSARDDIDKIYVMEHCIDKISKAQTDFVFMQSQKGLKKAEQSKNLDEAIAKTATTALQNQAPINLPENESEMLKVKNYIDSLNIDPYVEANPVQANPVQQVGVEVFNEEELKKLKSVQLANKSRQLLKEQISRLTKYAEKTLNGGKSKNTIPFLRSALEMITKFSTEDFSLGNDVDTRRRSGTRTHDMEYVKAVYYLKSAYAVSDGILKNSLAVLLKTMDESSKGKLNINDVPIERHHTYHDQDISDKYTSCGVGAQLFFEKKFEPLFAREPSVSDISQGELGDCYFLSELAGIVAATPELIKNSMVDEGDTVAVRFYKGNTPVIIRVDKTVPRAIYSNSYEADKFAIGHLWVQMLEKAYMAYFTDKNYDDMVGGIHVNYLTKLLVPNADFDTHILNVSQTGNLEQRLFIYGHVDYSESLTVLRNVADAKRFGGVLTTEQLGNICDNPSHVVRNPVAKAQEVAEDNAYVAITELLDINLKNKKISYAETNLDTIRKQIKITTDDFKNRIDEFKQRVFSQEEIAKGNLWLLDRIDAVYYLLDGYIDSIIIERTNAISHQRDELEHAGQVVDRTLGSWNDYKPYEQKDFDDIQKAITSGKYVRLWGLRRDELIGKEVDANGRSTDMRQGVMESHSYQIIGTKEVNIDGFNKKLVLVKNPHNINTATYRYSQQEGFTRETNKNAGTAGIFWMDIRDLESCFASFHVCDMGIRQAH